MSAPLLPAAPSGLSGTIDLVGLDHPDALPSIEVFLYLWDEEEEHLFRTNHRLSERPDTGTVKALLEEATRDYRVLYPDAEPTHFDTQIEYLNPYEISWPAQAR